MLIVNGIEDYFREILDKNEIDHDGNVPQFNNMYMKDNLRRICNSKEFIDILWNQSKTHRDSLQTCAKYDGNRYCTNNTNIHDDFSIPLTTPATTIQCISNKDCNVSYAENIITENERLNSLLRLEPQQDTDPGD